MIDWKVNKKTGKLESPALIAQRKSETIKSCLILIFVVAFIVSLITNVMLVREGKMLKEELDMYEGQQPHYLIQA